MRSNKDIRYSPKIDDIVYLVKDVKTHIGKKMMIPQNTPCKVTWHNFDSITLLVLAGPTVGETHTIRSNNSRAQEAILPFKGNIAGLIYG